MKSILIVDDDPSTIKGLQEHVPWKKLEVEIEDIARNGVEALEKIRLSQPDILITDIYMPEMDGLELIKHVRKEFPNIYIIIHSGYDDFDNARQAMKYGVQYFLLKPCIVFEIETVICEIIGDMLVQKKQKQLLENYSEEMDEYLDHTKELLFREMLIPKSKTIEIPNENLELFNLSEVSNIVVASLSIIRFPYYGKSKEREWQIKKFGTGNIIKETIEDNNVYQGVDIYVIDYSDFTFLIIFISKNADQDLNVIGEKISKVLIDNILLFLEVSLVVGIGEVKQSIHELKDSYMESQRALEAAEYQEINRVYTYKEVQSGESMGTFQYPFDSLKEINDMINNKEYELVMDQWNKLEDYLLTENKVPILVSQNICISIVTLLTIQEQAHDQIIEEEETMHSYFLKVYAMQSPREIIIWARNMLQDWSRKMKEKMTGKTSNKLIREVKNHVQSYYDQEIVLAEIAKSLYVNRNYLSQLFKKVTGETFVTYLNKYRIDKAKEKIKENNYMIYEISEMVGYQNPTYFSYVFKSITGVSPSEFYK